ncbi:triose-phosphate isomerase [Apibacter sp. HY039]|uniref:triose-phosphate isomerase n=1 Tax=Apibacter sp. HY039 TaxID=2501476 RepID=UPI000FEBA67B|nr:triose-phosphate isomerase [Apibacter sp. HY039]
MTEQKKIYLGTNTKMYKNISQTECFLRELNQLTSDIGREKLELFVIPSFTALANARNCVPEDKILIGAQNMNWEDEGQFTGEISPLMLKEVGVNLIEIGHSERRHILKETDQEINKKVLSALNHSFKALLCIGETLEQKNFHTSNEILRIQLKIGLHGIKEEQITNLWIAYEPVWAIGVNGIPATKEYAAEKHSIIRDTLKELFGSDKGKSIPILYGGSVNLENANDLIQMPDIDGLFIGRSAWDANNFNTIIRNVIPLFYSKK